MVQFDRIRAAYQNWKSLNEIISKDMKSRKVNLPEAISENIACYALGLTRNMNTLGDATDDVGKLIEIKACANFNSDLSSFSPKTQFERLIFVRLDQENDMAYLYDLNLNGEQFGKLPVNSKETVAEQQAQGRRPRLSLIKYIEKNNIPHLKIVSLK